MKTQEVRTFYLSKNGRKEEEKGGEEEKKEEDSCDLSDKLERGNVIIKEEIMISMRCFKLKVNKDILVIKQSVFYSNYSKHALLSLGRIQIMMKR